MSRFLHHLPKPERAKKPPGMGKEKRRHLLERVSTHAQGLLENEWGGWGRHPGAKQPPAVVRARAVVAKWEAEQNREIRKRNAAVRKLAKWAEEAVHFRDQDEALAVVREFERLTAEEASRGVEIIGECLTLAAERRALEA